jgi:hypothetical protein
MRLIAEKHHLVPQKDLVDSRYGLLRQIAGKPYVPDLSADTSGKRDYIGFRDCLLYGCKFGHGNLCPLEPRAAGKCSTVTGRNAIGGATPVKGAVLLAYESADRNLGGEGRLDFASSTETPFKT